MYQIKCDRSILFDPRDDALVVLNPKCKLEVNTCGEASFTILPNHPNIKNLVKLRSVFEITQGTDVIFRGRMTNDTKDFNNRLDVDLEGALAYANDTIIPPFKFPEDAQFADAANSANVVAYLLQWVIDKHNEQASDFQKFQLGNVTVTDPNNTIVRSEEGYATTWDILRSKFFESSLGGYMVVRYGANGVNYIDYLSKFDYLHSQKIVFGENLMDIERQTNADETYTAMLPTGAESERTESAGDDYEGDYVSIANTKTVNEALTLESLPDGALSDDGDIIKQGKFIYSKSGVNQYGWICMPLEESKFEDVTNVDNLKTKAVAALKSKSTTFAETIRVQGLDLHFTDSQIAAFRICRNVIVSSKPHNISGTYPLEKLEIDLLNPQNTIFTIGATERVLTSRASSTAKSVSNIVTNYPTTVELFNKVNKLEKAIFQANVTTDDACSKVSMNVSAQYGDLKKEVTGLLALEILEADDGSYYSQLRAEVEKVLFTADEIEIQSDYFTLKGGEITTKSGTQETIIKAGSITHQWRDDSAYYEQVSRRYYNRVNWTDSVLNMSREFQGAGYSGSRDATIGWWSTEEYYNQYEGEYVVPFLITSKDIVIGSSAYEQMGGQYDTRGELRGRYWAIWANGDGSDENGVVDFWAESVRINGDDVMAAIKALEARVAALE